MLADVSATAILIAALSVCIVVLMRVYQSTQNHVAIRVIIAITAPLSIINTAFFIFNSPHFWVNTVMLISVVCCVYLALKYGNPDFLKTLAVSLSFCLMFPIGFIGFLDSVFGNIAINTVVKTVESPNEAYYAQVIDNDQGALGGNTYVDVSESKLNLLLFRIEKKPKRVYSGDWGEFENMQIYWKDDHCLVINYVEYKIQ